MPSGDAADPNRLLASYVDRDHLTGMLGCLQLLTTRSESPFKKGDVMTNQCRAQSKSFRLEEATIDGLHQAIKSGQTTCVAIVQHYIDRVRAFNGVASALVTEDGAPVPEAHRRGWFQPHTARRR